MKIRLSLVNIVMVALFCLSSSGCWFLVVGGVGAVSGYAISRDTFEGVSNKGQQELLTAARRVISIMGTLLEDRSKDGEISGVVYGAHVTVTVEQINLTSSKLRVKARKAIFPRIAIAQEVYIKIMNQMEQ